MQRGYRGRPESRRSSIMLPPSEALRWPVYLLWWTYVFLLALSPLPALAQETLEIDRDGFLSNGCRWDSHSFELNCSALGLTDVPYIHPNISGVMKKLNLVNNSLETLTIEDIKDFREVTLLDLRSNNIRVIDDEVFSRRYMQRLEHLFLSRNQLSHLPLNVFKFTVFTTLDLSYNKFKYPPPALGNTNQITTLLLNNNPFEGLMKDSLANISYLVTLELSACNLTNSNLDPEVFSAFTSLRKLYLDLNYFPYVQRTLFAHIPSLKELYMQQCGIVEIEKRAFKSLNFLIGLYLGHNNITELLPNTFRDLNMDYLDLSHCGIQNIRKGAFRTRITERLYLSHNNITVLHNQDFKELKAVKYIDLSYSNVSEIKGSPFVNLSYLEELHLQHNRLEDEDVNPGALNTSGRLLYLDLTANMFTSIPDVSGRYLPHLHHLDIGENRIAYIGRDQLRNMTSLYVLVLRGNPLEYIHNDAFLECKRVTDLNLDFTRIKRLPDMSKMARLTDLHIIHSSLEYFPEDFCTTNPHLIILEATNNNLQKMINFSGCKNLFSLALDHNDIPEIPNGTLTGLTKLEVLKLEQNRISYIAPGVFDDLRILKSLTLYHNSIAELPPGIFGKVTALRKLNLGFNSIPSLPSGIFANNTILTHLWLNDNNIKEVHPAAFAVMLRLDTLNMSSNYFCSLEFPDIFPSLRILDLERLWCLHNVPNPHKMPHAQEIHYTYAYHCCLWEDTLDSDVYENDTEQPTVSTGATDEVTLPTGVVPILDHDPFEQDCNPEGGGSPDRIELIEDIAELYNLTIVWGPGCRFTIEGPPILGLTADEIANLKNGEPTSVLGENQNENVVVGTDNEEVFEGVNIFRHHFVPEPTPRPWKEVKCFPRPNPLTPCDNLLDPWPIRVAIWAVWVLTLLGNIAVLFVMIAARQKMDVSQFFICVLAFSNILLGIYLSFIAMVDIRTLGDRSFYQSALEWQKGSGCQTAGFLAIFSSQLSVYILVILNIERLYNAVRSVRAPYLKEGKKLHLAAILIIVGILYACILAVLPLNGVGINAYDEVAICLPFVTETAEDRNYLLAILSLNMMGILMVMVAFLVVFGYLFRPSLSRRRRCEILKSTGKLSLLMATTFLCWFPLGVVGYLSVLQEPVINAEQSKYFIVFVLPINALFSPLIYAVITRSFRRNVWWMVTCCPSRKSKHGSSTQTFKLIQRQATSTPTSLMSSDVPRGQSPLTGEELRVLRQSRRSNSYSVQFNPNSSQNCSTPPTPGSITRMGRRASLPAVFGSNIADKNPHYNGCITSQPPSLPFRFAPGLLSQLNSSLPNLPEENENEETEVHVVSETQMREIPSSPGEQLVRKLSTVPEGDEADAVGDGHAVKDDVHHYSQEGCIQEEGFVDDASVASNESVEYVDAQDSRDGTPTMICFQPPCTSVDKISLNSPTSHTSGSVNKSGLKEDQLNLESTCGVSEVSLQDSNIHTNAEICTCGSFVDTYCPTCSIQEASYSPAEITSFDYCRLHEPSHSPSNSKRFEIVNPRFAAASPTEGSETDV